MAKITIDIKEGSRVLKSINLSERDAKNPFSTGSIGYNTTDTIDIDGKSHTLNVLMIQKGSKGSYKSK